MLKWIMINMAQEQDDNNKAGMKELIDNIDFDKLEDVTGIKGLSMVESGKAFSAQLEYLQRLFDAVFDMQSQFFIRYFSQKRYTAEIYLKYFPKGREFYLQQIGDMNAEMEKMMSKIPDMVKDLKDKIHQSNMKKDLK